MLTGTRVYMSPKLLGTLHLVDQTFTSGVETVRSFQPGLPEKYVPR